MILESQARSIRNAAGLQHAGLVRQRPGGAERGLRDGIALFQAAERLGYQSSWAEGQRRLARFLQAVEGQVLDVVKDADEAMVARGTALRAEKYTAYDHQRRTEGRSASKPRGALTLTAPAREDMLVSPVFQGSPDTVAAALKADLGISAADELVLFLPPAFGLTENERLLADTARYVAPALGWVAG